MEKQLIKYVSEGRNIDEIPVEDSADKMMDGRCEKISIL